MVGVVSLVVISLLLLDSLEDGTLRHSLRQPLCGVRMGYRCIHRWSRYLPSLVVPRGTLPRITMVQDHISI